MKLLHEFFTTKSIRKHSILFILLVVISLTINTMVNWWVKIIIEMGANGEDTTIMMAVFFTVLMIQTFIGVWKFYLSRDITQVSFTDIMNRLCRKVLDIDYNTFTTLGEGSIQATFGFTNSVSLGGMAMCQLVEAAFNFIIVTVAIGMISLPLLIPVAIIYGIGGILAYKINAKIGKYDKKITKLKHQRQDLIQKLVGGFAEIRAMNMQDETYEAFVNLNNATLNTLRGKISIIRRLNGLLDTIDTLMMMAILFYAPVMIKSGITTASVMALVMYGWRLVKPLISVVDYIDQWSTYQHEFEDYEKFMANEITIKEGMVDLKSFDTRIRFENVSFQYNNSHDVLKDISFTVDKGQKIGIVGVSGCGKSTMLKLLERFYDPTAGKILIDGINIKDCTFESLHSRIGIVQQDTYVFKGTILENLIYGSKGSISISMRMVEDACKKAAIFDFIDKLPKRFDTDIGPNGLKLSGGEKQRIAIARLFIKDPDIILLDEASSALDNDSELIVQTALEQMQGKTVIAVAHRLSTIKNSDKILVMDEHQIVEQGTHESLMLENGVYARLYREKKGGAL
ncbi:ABC transporter ATP-binding protein [uncultured Duncaniella sp.]|uniref:ABC transporter ATP-binding protein n=1 Tax=uncultured Duncaniella sp. TaxID=2768039 RepID=UPI002601F456|nr:ABC transporter ATP-binding protein [uncultured Duncaniella sp.]